ncbi:MAG: hypothetical protein NE334_07720 [Lentisphaeraceae bacterium]|nr:hypothetical protein [Lentisphaeraceae bacterium]
MTPPKTFIDQLLYKAARRVTRHDLYKALVTSLIYFIFAQLIFVVVDQNFNLEESDRLIAASIVVLPPFLFFFIYSLKRLSSKINFIYIAQQIEKFNPEIENRLVSHYMTRHRSSLPKQKLIEDLKKLQISSIPKPKILKKLNYLCLAVFVTFITFSIASQKPAMLSLGRLYAPLSQAPFPSKTQIFKVLPENGETIKVINHWHIHIISKGIPPKQGYIKVFNKNSEGEKFLLSKTAENIYETQIPVIGNKCEYTIYLGDYVSEVREINFIKNIQIKEFSVAANLPSYTSSTQLKSRPKDLALLKGSTIEFNIKFDQKVHKADIYWQGKYHPLKINFDEAFSQLPFLLDQSTYYWLRYMSNDEKRVHFTTKHKIISIKDTPPSLHLLNTSSQTNFTDNQVIQLSYTAEDDISLNDISLSYETRFSKNKKRLLLNKGIHDPSTENTISLNLKELNFSEGDDRLVVYIEATDNNPENIDATRSNNLIFDITPTRTISSTSEPSETSKSEQQASKSRQAAGQGKGTGTGESQQSKHSENGPSQNPTNTEGKGIGKGPLASTMTGNEIKAKSGKNSQQVDHGTGNKNERQLLDGKEVQQAIRQNNSTKIDLDLQERSVSKGEKTTKKEQDEPDSEIDKLPFEEADGDLSKKENEEGVEMSLKVFEENNDFLSNQEKILVHEFFKELRRLQKKRNSQ